MPVADQAIDPADEKAIDADQQRMLDEALEMTFPASDPVAVSAAHRRPPKEAARPSTAKPKLGGPGT